jgi:hypothetical protein
MTTQSGPYATVDETYKAGAQAGWDAAQKAALAERNRLARACAEANDERDEERRQHAETRELLRIRDEDLEELRDEFERLTGRDWTAEQARKWSG